MKRFLVPIQVDQVTGLSLPTELSDAANKEYVDTRLSVVIYQAAVAPLNSEEVMRVSATGVKSALLVIDADYDNGTSSSFQLFAKIVGTTVHWTISSKLGDNLNSTLGIDLTINSGDLVVTASNTHGTSIVTVEASRLH